MPTISAARRGTVFQRPARRATLDDQRHVYAGLRPRCWRLDRCAAVHRRSCSATSNRLTTTAACLYGANCSDGPIGQPETTGVHLCRWAPGRCGPLPVWVHSEYLRNLALAATCPTRRHGLARHRSAGEWHVVFSLSVDATIASRSWAALATSGPRRSRELAARKPSRVDFGTAYVVPGWLTGTVAPTFCPQLPSAARGARRTARTRDAVHVLADRTSDGERDRIGSVGERPRAGRGVHSLRARAQRARTRLSPAPVCTSSPRGSKAAAVRMSLPCWQWQVVGRITHQRRGRHGRARIARRPASPRPTEFAPPDSDGQ